MDLLKKFWQDIAAIVLFLLISLAYFFTPMSQGLVLGGHDNTGGIGAGHEQQEYLAKTGERTRWTNSLFSGMPTYQLSPSYSSTQTIAAVQSAYSLGTTNVLCYVFLYLLGFYILMRAFDFRVWLSALGAIVWAFSSYFFIIIAAGHIWKVMTLAFIPPTIAGMVLCYRGKLLWGGAVTAIFTMLQIYSNHLQMTYYFLFVMLLLVIGYLVDAIMKKTLPQFLRATGILILAGGLGIAANFSNIYHTYEYSKETMRGKAELTPLPAEKNQTTGNGLERDYITQWSYGIGETWSLMIPNIKGGGNGQLSNNEKATDSEGYQKLTDISPQLAEQLDQYWGDQPGTVGPVYVGALVCFLFVLAWFYVKGPVKWALLAATLLSFLFAWGKNSPDLTNFFIDHLPGYNKFRAVSSAMVIAEFTIPLLAMLGLANICRKPEILRNDKKYVFISLGLTAGICLLFAVFPSMSGSFISTPEQQAFAGLQSQMSPDMFSSFKSGLSECREAILTADAWRSFFIIILGFALIWFYRQKVLKAWMMCAGLALICLIDMWGVDRRYLNDDNFTTPEDKMAAVQMTAADRQILQDKDPDYRVLDLTHDTFNDNTAGYWHKNIGGYHAAKLRRYQDLIDRCITPEIQTIMKVGGLAVPQGDSLFNVLNMLNMKYLIAPGQDKQPFVVPNPNAFGCAWFVANVKTVEGADAEMAGVQKNNMKHTAIVEKSFASTLGSETDSAGTVKMKSYLPNELHYTVNSQKGGVVVFSEIYYPEWTATVDGKTVDIARADYILRALKVPAGQHEVVFTFHPKSIVTTEAVAYTALSIIALAFIAALILMVIRNSKKKED